MKIKRWMWAVVAVFLAVIVIAGFVPVASTKPYAYDEADYMWAGKQGLWANATDRDAVPLTEYVRRGLELFRDPSKRSEVSRFLRGSGDLGMYRHYHGPVYFYWLAIVDGLGVKQEGLVRASGLVVHAATAMVLLFGFWWLFPHLPSGGAFLAAALFLFNRTALVAATNITQHGMFTFWCAVSMVLLARYAQQEDRRWMILAGAATGFALATVETAAVLGGAVFLTLLYRHWGDLKNWRLIVRRLLEYTAGFVVGLLVIWPAGVLKLAVVKGFMLLAYFTFSARSTFSPMGPIELLRVKLETSPWELSFLLIASGAAFALGRKVNDRDSLFPWLAFTALFLLMLLKITAPYTYYYAPLTMAMTMISAVAVSHVWAQYGPKVGGVVVLAAIISMAGSGWQHYVVMKDVKATKSYLTSLLAALDGQIPSGNLLVPYQAVPTLHQYRQEIKTIGYDKDWSIDRLRTELRKSDTARLLLCEETFCRALGDDVRKLREVDAVGPNQEVLYLAEVTGR